MSKIAAKISPCNCLFPKNKNYKMMGNWTELADAITELLLNSGYVADEGSHNNDANAPRNDVNINIGL